jgi:hypothetical protein
MRVQMTVEDSIRPMRRPLLRLLKELFVDVTEGAVYFDVYGLEGFYMRLLLIVGAIESYYSDELPSRRAALVSKLSDLLDEYRSLGICDLGIETFLNSNLGEIKTSNVELPVQRSGWENECLSRATVEVPKMLCPVTMSYYKWLARTFRGTGEIVELGCWMGCSTCCLAEGLLENPFTRGAKIHVFDSFVWLDWMNSYTFESRILESHLSKGSSFLDYFWTYCERYRDILDVHRGTLKVGEDEFGLPEIEWRDRKIGILIMDFADDWLVNDAMWRIFSPSFVPENTIVVFNQYGNVRAKPVREFCNEHNRELSPIHKPWGSAKAFLYKGQPV